MTNKDSDNTSPPNNSLNEAEAKIGEALKAHLDMQAENLDFSVTSKLSAARHRALAQERLPEHNGKNANHSRTRSSGSWFNWTNAVGSTAVVALAIVLGTQFYPLNTSQNNGVTGPAIPTEQLAQHTLMEDLNMLSAADDIEFYQNVEFLEWMENNSG